jgi:hypothetical protein
VHLNYAETVLPMKERFAQAQRFSRINRRLRRDRTRVRPQLRGIGSGWEPADRW